MPSEEPVYSCNKCEYTANGRQELAQHLEVAHSLKIFKCQQCPFISCHNSSFNRHKRVVHNFISCEVCGVLCQSEEILIEHTKEAHSDLLTYQEFQSRRLSENKPDSNEETFDLTREASALYLSQFKRADEVNSEPSHTDVVAEKLSVKQNGQEKPAVPLAAMQQRNKKQYQCKDCDFLSLGARSLLYHRRDEHDDRSPIYECQMCLYANNVLAKLERHNQQAHRTIPSTYIGKKKKSKFPVCKSLISGEESVNAVLEKSPLKSPKTKFPCTKCDYESKSKFLLAQHEKTVHLKKTFFRCIKCGFVCKERDRYNKHVKTHEHSSLKLTCTKCPFSTTNSRKFELHSSHHIMTVGNYRCEHCTFVTNSKKSFSIHKAIHMTEMNFPEEPLPAQSFVSETSPKTLEGVSIMANKFEKPTLNVAKKSFKKPVPDESPTFVKQKPFNTAEPKKVWKNKRKRSPSLSLSCALCIFKTRSMNDIERHVINTHCTDKPYECKYCGYKCRWKGDMKKHMIKQHNKAALSEFLNAPSPLLKYYEEDSVETFESVDQDLYVSGSETPPAKKLKTDVENLERKSDFLHATKSRTIAPPFRNKCEGYWPTTETNGSSFINKSLEGSTQMEQLIAVEENGPKLCMSNDQTSKAVNGTEILKDSQEDDDDNLFDRYLEAQQNCFHNVNSESNPALTKEILVDVKNKKFKCTYCPFTSKTVSKFHIHMLQHLNKKPYKCSACSYRSNWENCLKKHIKKTRDAKHKMAGQIIEELGNINFDKYNKYLVFEKNSFSQKAEKETETTLMSTLNHGTKANIPSDNDVDKNPEVYRCRFCKFEHSDEKAIIDHVKSQHQRKPNVIEEKTSSPICTEVEQKKNVSVKDMQCQVCPFTSLYSIVMKKHMTRHVPRLGARVKCPHCPYWVNHKKNLKTHLRFHASIKDESLLSKTELSKYINTDDVLSQNKGNNSGLLQSAEKMLDMFYCDACPFNCLAKSSLLHHKQFHRSNNRALFKCTDCSFWCNFKQIMTKHMNLHKEIQHNEVQDELEESEKKDLNEFKCQFCPMVHKTEARHRIHENQHSNKKTSKFACQICNYRCNRPKTMKNHMLCHGDELANEKENNETYHMDKGTKKNILRRRKCKLCPMAYHKRRELLFHRTLHKTVAQYSCPLCTYSVDDDQLLNIHIKLHKKGGLYAKEDTTPPKKETTNDLRVDPTLETPTETKISCSLCPTLFKSKVHLEQHLKLHGAQNKYTCKVCNYSSGCSTVVQRHSKVHKTEVNTENNKVISSNTPVRIPCALCPAVFTNRARFRTHTGLHGAQNKYTCSTCNYSSRSFTVLRKHSRVHDVKTMISTRNSRATAKIICPLCPSTFLNQDSADEHDSLHGAQNRYTCEKCNYSVSDFCNLEGHNKVHEIASETKDSRDMEIAEPAFSGRYMQDSLISNSPSAKKNTGKSSDKDLKEKQLFLCSQCPYTNYRKDVTLNHLSRHARTHCHVLCPYCDFTTTTASLLKDHIKFHFKARKFLNIKAYMKCDFMEIWSSNGNRTLIFKDNGIESEMRFYPELEKELEILNVVPSIDTMETNDLEKSTKIPSEVHNEIIDCNDGNLPKIIIDVEILKNVKIEVADMLGGKDTLEQSSTPLSEIGKELANNISPTHEPKQTGRTELESEVVVNEGNFCDDINEVVDPEVPLILEDSFESSHADDYSKPANDVIVEIPTQHLEQVNVRSSMENSAELDSELSNGAIANIRQPIIQISSTKDCFSNEHIEMEQSNEPLLLEEESLDCTDGTVLVGKELTFSNLRLNETPNSPVIAPTTTLVSSEQTAPTVSDQLIL